MSSCNELFFWSRTNCPICGSHQTQLLFECAFTQDPLRSIIHDHYKHQGRIDWQCLEGLARSQAEGGKSGFVRLVN